MFQTWHREQEHFCSEPGCGEKILYSPEFDRFGVMTLKESGKEDFYAFIQSHKDSVDLHKIMDRFNAGDTAALQKVQGMFGDFSQMPQTYAGLLNHMIEAEQTFMSLPLETREKFGQSFHAWLAQAGSESWLEAMGMVTPPATGKPAGEPPAASQGHSSDGGDASTPAPASPAG